MENSHQPLIINISKALKNVQKNSQFSEILKCVFGSVNMDYNADNWN